MKEETKKIIIGSISLIAAILFFSGYLKDVLGGVFDFAKLTGAFPSWFSANGNGIGAKGGFLFALTLIPSVMLALGMISIFEHYGALFSASKFLNPILKPLMGIPGVASISLIASLQSTDAGSSTTKLLKDEGKISEKELLVFAAFQFSSGAMITNFLSSLAPLLTNIQDATGRGVPTTILTCFGVILLFKFIGANIMRLYIKLFVKNI